MSIKAARRTEVVIKISGVDVSDDINSDFLSLTYTDNEQDKTDDLRIDISDIGFKWIQNKLKNTVAPVMTVVPAQNNVIAVDCKVRVKQGATDFDGTRLFSFVYSTLYDVLEVGRNNPDRIVIGLSGVVTAAMHLEDLILCDMAGNVIEQTEITTESSGSGSLTGAVIEAVIICKNRNSDGKDSVLPCGSFQIDSMTASGPPAVLSLNATSLPLTATVRTQIKSKAWENIKLSGIAREIANGAKMDCIYESGYDPLYKRKEQSQQSDIEFLSKLCKSAGVALKVTDNIIVLFDESDYENKTPIFTIKKGESDILKYNLSSNLNDTAYSSCHVSYTNPETGKVIEYTYTPRDSDGTGQVLEINEKVTDREEARQLAMKRLRQKNKAEFSAQFTLPGNTGLVAGVTFNVEGFGFYDGVYIVETATHKVDASGYTTDIKSRKGLKEY